MKNYPLREDETEEFSISYIIDQHRYNTVLTSHRLLIFCDENLIHLISLESIQSVSHEGDLLSFKHKDGSLTLIPDKYVFQTSKGCYTNLIPVIIELVKLVSR